MNIADYGFSKGHLIAYDGTGWCYVDTGEPISVSRPCKACRWRSTNNDDPDDCVGKIEGKVISFCCGHGACGDSHIMFEDGTSLDFTLHRILKFEGGELVEKKFVDGKLVVMRHKNKEKK